MASTQQIKIVVVDGGKASGAMFGGGGGSGVKSEPKYLYDSLMNSKRKNPNYKSNSLAKVLNWNQNLRNKMSKTFSPTTMMAVGYGVDLAKQVASSAISYYVSDIGRRTGDSNYQAMVNRRIEQSMDIASYFTSALGGAAAGAMVGGPFGAVIGATAGLATTAISQGYKYAERERSYRHEMFQQNNSQNYNLMRYGNQLTNGRLR
ncbi:MAG: hypothetical protein LBU60_04130 [Clostridiales bacterium]|jgi:hypothetical protein|nr:hypothetical protein [Clostridiales bacterium]